MRKNVLKTMALCAVLTMLGSGQVMAQKVELSHSVDNSLGYLRKLSKDGVKMDVQYNLGIGKHLDVLFDVAVGTLYSNDYRRSIFYTAPMGHSVGLYAGVRGKLLPTERLTLGLSLLTGVGFNIDQTFYDNKLLYVGLLNPEGAGRIDVMYGVTDMVSLGVYGEMGYVFSGTLAGESPLTASAGLKASFKLK